MRRRYVLTALIPLLLWGCSGTPSYVVAPDKMSKILADIHTAEGVVSLEPGAWGQDSARRVLRQSVLKKYDVTPQQLDTSMMWYGRHIDKYMKVYDDAIKILERRIAQAEKTAPTVQRLVTTSVTTDADSANVLDAYPVRRLSPHEGSDILTFNYASDRHWERGDIYRLMANLRGARSVMDMDLAVNYADGTTEYRSQQFAGDGTHDLVLVLDSAKLAQSIYGSITYVPARGEIAYMDSISLVRTRNHDDNAARRLRYPSESLRAF